MELLPQNHPQLQHLMMEVMITEREEGATPLVTYLYRYAKLTNLYEFTCRVIEGIATSSHGIYCAEIAGIGPGIVSRAIEISRALEAHEGIEPLPREVSIDQLEKEERMLRLFAKVRQVLKSRLTLSSTRKLQTRLH